MNSINKDAYFVINEFRDNIIRKWNYSGELNGDDF